MLLLLLDSVVLIALLKSFNDEEMGLLKACLTSLLFSILTAVLAILCAVALGPVGLFIGLALSAGLIGLVISWMFGIDVQRSILIGVIFIGAHFGMSLALNALFS